MNGPLRSQTYLDISFSYLTCLNDLLWLLHLSLNVPPAIPMNDLNGLESVLTLNRQCLSLDSCHLRNTSPCFYSCMSFWVGTDFLLAPLHGSYACDLMIAPMFQMHVTALNFPPLNHVSFIDLKIFAGQVMTSFTHVVIPTRSNWFQTNSL